jgi:hypothetical protein
MKPAASSFRHRQRANKGKKNLDYVVSCGNVFADLGIPNPEMHLAAAQKAHSSEEFMRLCEDISKEPVTAKPIDEILNALPAARRRKIEKRAAQLIAEEIANHRGSGSGVTTKGATL